MPLVPEGSGVFGKWGKDTPSLSLGCWCPRERSSCALSVHGCLCRGLD